MKIFLKSLLNTLSQITGYLFLNKKKMDFGIFLDRDIAMDVNLSEVKIVFDIGANIGNTGLFYRSIFPNGIIYAFEPVSDTYKILVQNTKNIKNIVPVNIGFSDTEGIHKVYLQKDKGLNSLNAFVNLPDQSLNEKFEMINIETVDQFCLKHNITCIDFLKTDAEGLDLNVLKGAENLIRLKKIKFILSEVGFNEDNKRNTNFEALRHYLYNHGYKLRGFYEQSNFGNEKFMVSVNALFSLQ